MSFRDPSPEMRAYLAGLAAFVDGARLASCPHAPGDPLRPAWRAGYVAARYADRMRRRAARRLGDYTAWPPGGT